MRSFSKGKNRPLRTKILLSGGIMLSVLLGFSLHLFNLQIVENHVWTGKARAVTRRSELIVAQRGLIWDRHYDQPLATNIDSFAIQIIPAEIAPKTPQILAEQLSGILNIPVPDILLRLPTKWQNSWNPVEIADNVTFRSIVTIAESSENFPGVHWQRKPYRYYSKVGSISHILGYVGNITTEELQVLYNQGYANTASLGKSGMEKSFDEILRGKDGRIFQTVDVKGKRLEINEDEVLVPENGYDIVLTIDRHIQELAEKALGPRKGAIVVLKPSTGEILAMVSYPSFDPNVFTEASPGNFSNLSVNMDFPFLNRTLQSGFAPASTFKLLMMAAALGENIDPNMRIDCRGVMTLGDRQFWCHKHSGHGFLNLREALEESCNIYFGTIGVDILGIETISRYARAFGLGSITGIELDGEITGIIPDKKWKEEIYNSPWTAGDTLNTSIGQGFISVSPLQMANLIAAIVNRGTIYRPYLLKEVRRTERGQELEHTEPEILRTIDMLDSRDYDALQAAMRGVVTRGTAQWVIHTKSVDIAGKTGTGEVGFDDRWHDWFVAYGPYKTQNLDERVVVVTMIEASESYDWWAPKATDIVFEGMFGENIRYEDIIEKWQERKVWWSWSNKELPKPGWPYIPPDLKESETNNG